MAARSLALSLAALAPLAVRADARRVPPTITINLDLPPSERFNVLLEPSYGFNATVWEFYTKYVASDALLKDALAGLVALRGDEPAEMQTEIESLAKLAKLPTWFVQGIQMLYEVQTMLPPLVNFSRPLLAVKNYTFEDPIPAGFEALGRLPRMPLCTGIIATNKMDGTVSHARNLDFFFGDVLNHLVYTGIFTRGGKELYRSQMIVGYQGIITGMRRGSNGYAIERNTRYGDHRGANKEMLDNLLGGRPLNGWVLREAIEACGDYESAIERIATAPFVSSEYSIISGVRKGTILSRNPDGVAYTQALGSPNFEEPDEYILITNFDFFYHDIREIFDPTGGEGYEPRRVMAQQALNATLARGGALTPDVLFATLNADGVLADTIFQAIINVELDVWNVSVPDPASLPHTSIAAM